MTPSLSPAQAAPPSPAAGSAAPYLLGARDLRIDLLRGFCVLVMIVDHILGRSPLYFLSGGDQFFTGAPEGFILVSGFTAGLTYRTLIARHGLAPALTKALRRGFDLYLLTVGLTLLFAPVSEFFRLSWAGGVDMTRSAKWVLSVLTLHSTYTFVNIMLLFTLLFLALPLALLLLSRGKWQLVLLASGAVWLLYQVYPDIAIFPWDIDGGHAFAFSSWQVLFFTAVVLGYHRDRLPRLTQRTFSHLHLLTGLAFAALIGLFALLKLPPDRLPGPFGGAAWAHVQTFAWDRIFEKSEVGVGRIVATAVVYGFLALSLTRWWRATGWWRGIERFAKGLLLPLGQHALYAWSAHVLFVLSLGLALRPLGVGEDVVWLNTAMQLLAIVVVWLLTKAQVLAPNARTRRFWYALPAVLALLALLFLQHPFFEGTHPPTAPPTADTLSARPSPSP